MGIEQKQVYGFDNSYDFFNHLCISLVPYIKSCKDLKEMRVQWGREKSIHQRRIDELEKEAVSSVEKAFKLLKKRIALSKEASTDQVKELMSRISDILELREPYVTPPYYEIAGDKLCDLCSLLISNGHTELLEGIANEDFIDRHEMQEGSLSAFKLLS